MKQLRAEGIRKLIIAFREDCRHLERLGRENKSFQACLKDARVRLEEADAAILKGLIEEGEIDE